MARGLLISAEWDANLIREALEQIRQNALQLRHHHGARATDLRLDDVADENDLHLARGAEVERVSQEADDELLELRVGARADLRVVGAIARVGG